MNTQELFDLVRFDHDESAFNALYRMQAVKLSRFAYTYIDDTEAGKEIVNDVFVKLWHNRDSLAMVRNIEVYLYVSVKNACLNHVKSTTSRKARELNAGNRLYFQLDADPAQLLISKQLQQEIIAAVNNLPPRCKLIFKMVKEDGLTSNEVATILDLSNKTVFAQLAIAVKKIETVISNFK
ncbi:RNA polymerase sigma-70 factor [Mucilaginibacter sp. JRF]|uniref:RNA polymerase sigma-70 factor n=1 Tax=Mucilaginibacter sp. JRF TaxID=2780088 RepID=UPI0018817F5F|nr:RNA polymerase sigma-70 factor [Mucilaginibacter sp. JRF]MBE9586638.1 RNA polymerase sigma-70 factor [Mucilaginibacter sp. JRF]